MALVLGWLVLSVVVGWVWRERGHNFSSGLLLSLFLSPLIGLIVGLVKKVPTEEVTRTTPRTEGTKKCPYCAEWIKEEAIVCRYCGRDMASPPTEFELESAEQMLARKFFDTGMYEVDLERQLAGLYESPEAAEAAKQRILAMRSSLS